MQKQFIIGLVLAHFMRAGFTYADYDYKLSGFQVGDFGNSDEEMRNYYFLLDCRF